MSHAPLKPALSTQAKAKRPRLTFSLRTFLVVTLVLSMVLGVFGRQWWKAYRDSQPPTLGELSQLAQRHGIPMPPQGAKLVVAPPKWYHEVSFGGPQYSPAFLLSEREDESLILLGCEGKTLPHEPGADLPWRPFAGPPKPDSFMTSSASSALDWSNSSSLICAIQLAERGDARGNVILQHIMAQGAPLRDCPLPVRNGALPDLREFVRFQAFVHLQRGLQEAPESWPEIRERMDVLLEESPYLRRAHAILVRDLAAAVDAPAPKAGSIEACLLDWSRDSKSDIDTDPAAQQILQRGFDAVPDLIGLRDDKRLTNHLLYEGMDGTDDFQRVGDLANRLLVEIRGAARGGGLYDEVLVELDTQSWQQWWEQAQAQGEREYCRSNLLTAEGQVRSGLMRILVHKHPETLATIGREYLQLSGSTVSPPRLAKALSFAEVPWPKKVEMLADLAQVGTPDDKRGVLKVLMQFDREQAIERFIQLFDEVQRDDRDFDFPSPNETFPYLVAELNDERLTKAYLQAARRNTPLRMELLSRLVLSHAVYERSTLRLALLAAFLDDPSPRERKPEYERFIPDDFTEISTGDFAAAKLARVFQLGLRPRLDWTAEQWSALREQVRQRLAEEELPELE